MLQSVTGRTEAAEAMCTCYLLPPKLLHAHAKPASATVTVAATAAAAARLASKQGSA
jgi:hypothetical protein